MTNYDAILKRARKVVQKVQDRENGPKINVIGDSEDVPEANGLVIVLFNLNDEVDIAA